MNERQDWVVVTGEVRIPLSDVIEAYADALSSDGGIDPGTTLNAYLAEYALGIGKDMVGVIPNAKTFYEWRLSNDPRIEATS